MKLAVFSDVHGNIHALQAVLDDMNINKPDMVFCAGDLVGYGAFPNKVIKIVRDLRIPVIMGNYDQGVGYNRPECGCAYKEEEAAERGHRSLVWSQKEVSEDNKRYLRGLLEKLTFRIYNKTVTIVHGSPRKINEYLFADRPEASILRVMEGEKTDVLICGHTHLPYTKNIEGKTIVNVGSTGKPKDGNPQAGYALVNFTELEEVKVEFPRVSYDVEAAAKAIEGTELPPEFAQALRGAKG